jgi:murein L,D-transpeptidase YafK
MSWRKCNGTRIVVHKSARLLELFDGDTLVRSCRVSLGFAPDGDKQAEGDGRTPEGEFYIFTKNEKSKYHLSLAISYPGDGDARRGLSAGLISPAEHDDIVRAVEARNKPPQDTALGGDVYIHGGGTHEDWTRGCIAVTNEDMDEIFHAVPVGASVSIVP